MPYTRYRPEQIAYLKQHYAHFSNAELARALGLRCARQVQSLARRYGLKWRAENGAPQWRPIKPSPAAPRPP